MEHIGFSMKPGPIRIMRHTDFGIRQFSQHLYRLGIGSPHISGSDDTEPASSFRKAPQIRKYHSEPGKLNKRDKEIYSVRR